LRRRIAASDAPAIGGLGGAFGFGGSSFASADFLSGKCRFFERLALQRRFFERRVPIF
jgi:hypothetical protein